MGLFEALFGALGLHPPAQERPWMAPAPVHRTLRRRPPKPRLANLPPAQDAKQPAKPPAAISDAEVVAKILSDATLRRGDIVVFPSGPKVFEGAASHAHRISDFDDIRSSTFIADATRAKVLAMTGLVAADMNIRVVKTTAGRTRAGTRARGGDVEAVGSVQVEPGSR